MWGTCSWDIEGQGSMKHRWGDQNVKWPLFLPWTPVLALRECALSPGTLPSWKETTQLLEGCPGSGEGERGPLTEIRCIYPKHQWGNRHQRQALLGPQPPGTSDLRDPLHFGKTDELIQWMNKGTFMPSSLEPKWGKMCTNYKYQSTSSHLSSQITGNLESRRKPFWNGALTFWRGKARHDRI